MGADLKSQLLNDIKKLSLEKYISEIVGGVMEGMLKCKNAVDINACVEVYRKNRSNESVFSYFLLGCFCSTSTISRHIYSLTYIPINKSTTNANKAVLIDT